MKGLWITKESKNQYGVQEASVDQMSFGASNTLWIVKNKGKMKEIWSLEVEGI